MNQCGFTKLGLSKSIVSVLNNIGYKYPTLVQKYVIPSIISGKDLLVSSPTGSGKTAAFILPAIEYFSKAHKLIINRKINYNIIKNKYKFISYPKLLILTPTRELALQITSSAYIYGKHLRYLCVASILGGVSYDKQLKLLLKNPDILVATPGRLLDYLKKGNINLSKINMLILDEADRMLDMGFIDDIENIVSMTPSTRQTALFSATLKGKVGFLIKHLLKNPKRIEIKQKRTLNKNIIQSVYYVDDKNHKGRLLNYFLYDISINQVIIFTSTKNNTSVLVNYLKIFGFKSAALHGDLPQNIRNRTIRLLRNGYLRILVATDVAARGIDIPKITHVINYDLPKFAEDYIHRIGRTGRAGRSGIALSMVNFEEKNTLIRIERFVSCNIHVGIVIGIEPKKNKNNNKNRFNINFFKKGYINSRRRYYSNRKYNSFQKYKI